jgi:hypothetical protein
MELQGNSGDAVGYRALQWATGAERSSNEIQGAHGSYKDLKKLKGSFGQCTEIRSCKELQGAVESYKELQ